MRFAILLLLNLLMAQSMFATHNRAGEITYMHLSGSTYEIKITTYTKLSAPADRPYLFIKYGDGSPVDSIFRQPPIDDIANDIRTNVYIKNHTYPGPGVYTLCVEDPNRIQDIVNLGGTGSVNIVFALETVLYISPLMGVNSSAQLTEPPLDDACVGQVFQHNPGAWDPDGDSLHFQLVPPLGPEGVPLDQGPQAVYVSPSDIVAGPDNNISIDPVTGTLTWDSPQQIGIYNIAILITEYRPHPLTGEPTVVGTVLRDMQIFVLSCSNNPPQMQPVPNFCVEAGQNINFQVVASDPNGDQITLTASGLPFEVASSPASYNQIFPSNNATFNWNTNCSHVRLAPYQVVFKALDNNPNIPLASFETTNITIVAPAPQNPTAEAALGEILLNWDVSPCNNAIGYKIYRRAGTFGFEPGPCETGVPAYTGYSLLTTLSGLNNTSYLDDNDISFGVNYCYMVIAYFADGAESYASEEFCAEIAAEIPLITHNSVGATSTTTGIDTVRWQRPFDLDTNLFAGPYQYRVYRGTGFNNANELIHTGPENESLLNIPGEHIVQNLNTQDQPYTYRVELMNDGESLVFSSVASSIFLSAEPSDEQLTLSWEFNQPWVNFNYRVEMWDDSLEEWILIEETDETTYVHTGLVNGDEYCHRIVAEGSYFNESFPDTVINFSQEVCEVPFDNVPPCPPELTVSCGECNSETGELSPNILEWTNTNDCEDTDDTEVYYIYFAPFEGEEFMLVDSVFGAGNTTYEHQNENSISGCYMVTALDYDFVNDRRNESLFSNVFCCDQESKYKLPNVFTPNNDGKNDFFQAFKPYCGVESIDLVVFNRWGQPVFKSTDPDFRWDGIHMDSGVMVPDGVYFYVCTINTIQLSGIQPFNEKGTVTLFGGKDVNFN